MAITSSVGYGGQVTEAQIPVWARALGGLDYSVSTATSWKVEVVGAAARTVSIPAGEGTGRGITDKSNGGDQVQVPVLAGGADLRYDLIVARRNTAGSGGTTSFTYVTGTADPVAAFGMRRTFEADETLDDQPLALVRVNASAPNVIAEVIDLRCWQANGGAVGASDYVREYLNRLGTHLTIGTTTWVRRVGSTGLPEWVSDPRPLTKVAAITTMGAGPVDTVNAQITGFVVPAGPTRFVRIHFQGHLYAPVTGMCNVKLQVGTTTVGIKNYRTGSPYDKVDVDAAYTVALAAGTYTVRAVTGGAPAGTAYDTAYIGQLTVEDKGPVTS